MEIKNKKSALAALATLGVTAIAAGTTAFFKIRQRRRDEVRQQAAAAHETTLTAEQQMVYNEAISRFISLNERLYDLRRYKRQLQPVVGLLAMLPGADAIADDSFADNAELSSLLADIRRFIGQQVPFINACLAIVGEDGMTYADHVRGPVGGRFDAMLDEEPTGADVADGAPILAVLKLGYYFPDSVAAVHPVKSIVLV